MEITISPQKSARLGIFCLREAVLEILEQPENREIGLKAGEISNILGIQSLSTPDRGMAYPVVTGILWQLKKEDYVTQDETYGPWKLLK